VTSDHPDVDWPMSEPAAAGDEYTRYAEIYDALFGDIADDAGYYLGLAARFAGEGGTVLELGTGTGRVAARFLEAGYEVVGLDASPKMLAVAHRKLGHKKGFSAMHADVRRVRLDRKFRLAIAPYGMVAHLLTDEDRLAAFRNTYTHLEPGGALVFDDMPGWLAGAADGTRLEQRRVGRDPATGMDVRLLSSCIDVAGQPLTVRYDFVDWFSGSQVARRLVIRVIFRNVQLADELRLLRQAGFGRVELIGDFDGHPFDQANLSANRRLIVMAHR
jgi:SAM-dependent methyltransferase